MSISVKNLTKIFGQQHAVDDISFEINEGEIVGFLGPNGAGKSTTMKIMTCYLPPSSGKVEVLGRDVTQESLFIQKNIGYLPEQNPLYTDMYIHEYLALMGNIMGLRGKQLKTRILEMIELCGLTREQNKKINQLSKGYRQRVGIAQTLLHNPKVLILDEPTTGLDPNQLVEIRNLIKNISKEKTVIFSSHIMQEVQALCDRVIIINKGKIVADDSVSSLQSQQETIIIAEFAEHVTTEWVEQIEGVEGMRMEGNKIYISIKSGKDVRQEIFSIAKDKNLPLLGLEIEKNSIEDIFHRLTQKEKAHV